LCCVVLCCVVLCCVVLSCLVLSCLVLSCLVLSCLVLPCGVLSYDFNPCLFSFQNIYLVHPPRSFVWSCLVLPCVVVRVLLDVTYDQSKPHIHCEVKVVDPDTPLEP
jgi:hypothetical protein